MKKHRWLKILLGLTLALMGFGFRAEAQQGFGFSVTPSASSLLVSNSLTYTINVTNFNVGGDLQSATISNVLSSAVQLNSSSAVNESSGTITYTATNYNGVIVFYLGTFPYGTVGAAQFTLTVTPLSAGFFTNTVTVSSPYATNVVTTNVVVQVTNIPPPEVDLGVAINGPGQPVITNDVTSYELTVTNAGPASAPKVVLTNSLPAGAIFRAASHSYTRIGNNLLFNLGALGSGMETNLQVSIEPTNVATLALLASVGAASSVQDTNTANNSASSHLEVIGYYAATLLATTNSPQAINFQNGLTEQTVRVTNDGTNSAAAVRLVVTGLNRQLYNAVGTNGGYPFVVYSHELATNQSVNLRLQFYPRGSFVFSNAQLHAYSVPLPDWTPPAVSSTSTNINISRLIQLSNGDMMIEFPAVANHIYTVVYSDNASFSNAMVAPPAIVAPANRVQWSDYGPPTTVSAPTNTPTRFYRVFENP